MTGRQARSLWNGSVAVGLLAQGRSTASLRVLFPELTDAEVESYRIAIVRIVDDIAHAIQSREDREL